MRGKFEKQLSKLNEELIHMGSMMEQAIEMAISALVKPVSYTHLTLPTILLV